MKLFNHVQIKVNDLAKSKKFYDGIMSTLGFNRVLEIEGTVIGYGTSKHDMFEIRQTNELAPLSQGIHIAFNAKSIEVVKSFYKKALEKGAKCNGKPGFRLEYEKGYYSAFIIELDGHNIEAVYKDAQKV